jgi:hypothetical protein
VPLDPFSPPTRRPNGPNARALALGLVLSLALSFALVALSACERRDPSYSQATPDEVLRSAQLMLTRKEPRLLTKLIYADSREYRLFLQRLGQLLSTISELSDEVATRFPNDVKRLRAQAEAAAKRLDAVDPKALLDRPDLRDNPPTVPTIPQDEATRANARETFERSLELAIADPLGLARRYADRLSVKPEGDDEAVIAFDNDVVLGGLIRLRKIDARWWLVLPLDAPLIANYAPETRGEWAILAYLVRALDNALKDLLDELRAGQIDSVKRLSERAGEIAAPPAVGVFIAYAKEMDVRQKRQRALRDFSRRVRDWARARPDADTPNGQDLTRRLVDVINRAAIEGMDRLVRQREATPRDQRRPLPDFKSLTDDELLAWAGRWLRENAAELPLSGTISTAQLDEAERRLREAALAPVVRDP